MAVKTVQAIVNGQTYNLTLNEENGQYEAWIKAPDESSYNVNEGHYYPVTIKAEDDAGNEDYANDTSESMGEALRLYAKETQKPTISTTYPTNGSYLSTNNVTITWQVRDVGTGINPETINLKLDEENAAADQIVKTPVTGGYNCSYATTDSLVDGQHVIKFDVEDYDGNEAVQEVVSFNVDTIPPSIVLSKPVENFVTNTSSVVVSGITNDATSGIDSLIIKVNDGEGVEVEIKADGSFSAVVYISEAENTIVVTATDGVGRTSSVTRIVKYDNRAPVISNPVISPNPVSTGELFKISVTVTDL